MFISFDEHPTSNNLPSTKLTTIVSESSYYIKNHQLPIAKLREIIFHNLLFILVYLEIFRLIFLLFKLIIVPQLNFVIKYLQKKKKILSTNMETIDHDTKTDNHSTIANDENVFQVSL